MTIHFTINLRKGAIIILAIGMVFGLLWAVDAIAAPYPAGLGGTGTTASPAPGQVLIGTGSGTYTPAYVLCAGTCSASSASGTITITGTGLATTTGDWQGTWQLYSPSDFLPSSTPILSGSGTLNCVPLFIGTSTISDSSICDDGGGNYYFAGHNLELDNGQVLSSVSGNIIAPDDGAGNVLINSGAAVSINPTTDFNVSAGGNINNSASGNLNDTAAGTITEAPGSSNGFQITDPTSESNLIFNTSGLTGNRTITWDDLSGTPVIKGGASTPGQCGLWASNGKISSNGCVYTLNGVSGPVNILGDGTTVTSTQSTSGGSTTVTFSVPANTYYPYSSNPAGYITTSTNNFRGLTNASITAVSPVVWSSTSTLSCPTCIATNTGNWAGTWQGTNSTTFYLASNPAGYVTSTSGGVSTSTANTWTALQTFSAGISAASITLPHANASGSWNYSLVNDGNYLEVNTSGTIPGTSPVPYDIILQNCPPVSTTSTAVTSSSWECALSQAENFPDGSRSFVDWDTEYYPTGTNPNIASGWFSNSRGTSSILFPFVLSWNDGSINHVGFTESPAVATSASKLNANFNLGTNGQFSVGTAATSTGAFVINQNGASTCAGIYDSGASTIYGMTDSLPAPAGCTALGGYYHGLAIGGSSSGTGTPIFGVLNSSQSSNGLGHTAFTVYDTNEVDTYNNVLDDKSGNAKIAGTLNASGTITQAGVTVCTTTNCLASSTALVSTFNGVSGTAKYSVTSANPFISIATSTSNATLTYSSSSLNLGTISSHASTDYLASSTPYVSSLNGTSGAYNLYAGGILSEATGTASTTVSLSTSTLNAQVAALGYVTSTSGGSGLASTTPWTAQTLVVASGTGVATISSSSFISSLAGSYIPFIPQVLGTSTQTMYYFGGYSNGTAATNSIDASNTIYALPIFIAENAHITNIESDCEGSCSGNARVGVYTDVGGLPGSLLLDAGTSPLSIGTYNVSGLNAAVHPGQYWLVIDYSVNATIKSYSTNSLIPIGGVSSISPSTPNYAAWTASLAFGALPSTFPTSSLSLAAAPPFPIVGVHLNP